MRILLLLLLLGLWACGPVQPAGPNEATNPFFDLAGYIDEQVSTLEGETAREKTVTINGTTETQTDVEIDYAKDLSIIRRADINRPAWREKYKIETTDQITEYLALDTTLATQLLRVTRGSDGTVEEVYVEGRDGSILSQESRRLRFRTGEGYSIYSNRSSGTVGNAEVAVTVVF